jgi:hypothetical protein
VSREEGGGGGGGSAAAPAPADAAKAEEGPEGEDAEGAASPAPAPVIAPPPQVCGDPPKEAEAETKEGDREGGKGGEGEDEVNAWILLSLVNTVNAAPEDSLDKLPVTTIELSITFRLLDGAAGGGQGLAARQTAAVADLLKVLEVITHSCLRPCSYLILT